MLRERVVDPHPVSMLRSPIAHLSFEQCFCSMNLISVGWVTHGGHCLKKQEVMKLLEYVSCDSWVVTEFIIMLHYVQFCFTEASTSEGLFSEHSLYQLSFFNDVVQLVGLVWVHLT